MAATIYHLEIDIQGYRAHSYYSALKALWIDNKEDLPVSLSTLEKWDWSKDFEKDNVVIRKAKSFNTREVREHNWIDELPPDVGAEHFEIKK